MKKIKSIVVLVGNGFNCMLKGLISKEYYNQDMLYFRSSQEDINNITYKIDQIINLWEKFDILFEELLDEYTTYKPEDLIKMIYTVLEFLANADDLSKIVDESSREHLYILKRDLERCIFNKIIEISEEFRNFEEEGIYGKLKQIYPDFGRKIKEIILDKEINKSYFVTTNYDGLFLDTLLCSSKKRGNDWFFSDGFGGRDKISYYEPYFKRDHIRVHLHGSYRFYNDGLETVKIDKGNINDRPVMIFNQPELKEKQIKKYDILRHYYEEFINRLSNSNKLFIIGNSLKYEPHIRNIISQNFNHESNEICIFDTNPNNVEGELKTHLKSHLMELKMNIKKINTEGFENMNQFLNEFSRLLN